MCIPENRITLNFSVITFASYIFSITKAAFGRQLGPQYPLEFFHSPHKRLVYVTLHLFSIKI